MEEKKIEYRDFKIDSKDTNTKTIEMSVSSESPVNRNWNGVQGREVLDHSPGSVDLSRFETGPAHYCWTMTRKNLLELSIQSALTNRSGNCEQRHGLEIPC